MKNLKKVLALVMAFAMAFTMFAGAVDFSDVKPGDDYSAAISMLSDLEVISGNGKGAYEPAKTITRAEACVLMANIMNGGKADTARFAGGSNFSDVAHGWWGESAIAYCVQNGITYGVGGGKFAPNREITDAEFVAMLTRAMGYDTAANPLSFPYGNYTAAVNNGLLDNVPYVEGSDCTKGEAAQMLYDALFADYARMSANLNVIHNSDDHDEDCTLIHDVFGLDKACDDKDNCKQHYWVITGESCEDEDVIFVQSISDKGNEVGKSKVTEFDCTADVSALIGYKVILWGEDEHATDKGDVDTVKAVEVVDDQVAYEFNPTMDLEDDLGLKDKEVKTVNNFKANEVIDMLETKNGNSYVLIDWDNDGDIDWINDTVRYYGEITSLTSKKVIVDVADGDKYVLDLEDGETKYHGEDHDYVVEIDAEEGDIVEIVVDDAYETTLTITITAVEPETKEFTKLDKKGNVYFDDATMEQAEENVVGGVEVDDLAKANLETDYDIWTDANGFIIYMEETSGSTEYAMLLGVEDGKESGIASKREKAVIEVMYVDGTTAELNVAFDASITGYDTDDYYFVNEENIVGGIFKIEMDDDGDVDAMTLVNTTATSYTYSDKFDEIKYGGNTVELTGEDFVFVVDEAYVKDTRNGKYVDTDLVAILAVEDLEDIDVSAQADDGAYVGDALVVEGVSKNIQNASDDEADGALFVVDDLADYLGTKTHVVGLITNISVSSKDVFTFEVDGVDYSTAKDATTADLALDAADKTILDVFYYSDVKDLMEEYGNGLYADLTIRNDEVVKVYLLVDGNNAPKAKSAYSDFVVIRALTEKVASDYVRVYTGAVAANADEIYTVDEVKDASLKTFELTSDTVIYDVNDEPAMAKDVALNSYLAYDKTSIESGALVESDFNKADKTDIFYVVDIIYDETDDDDEVVNAYAFEPVDDFGPYYADVANALAAAKAEYNEWVADRPAALATLAEKEAILAAFEAEKADAEADVKAAADAKAAEDAYFQTYKQINDIYTATANNAAASAEDKLAALAAKNEATEKMTALQNATKAANEAVAANRSVDAIEADITVAQLHVDILVDVIVEDAQNVLDSVAAYEAAAKAAGVDAATILAAGDAEKLAVDVALDD